VIEKQPSAVPILRGRGVRDRLELGNENGIIEAHSIQQFRPAEGFQRLGFSAALSANGGGTRRFNAKPPRHWRQDLEHRALDRRLEQKSLSRLS
jgi:hypothetical protein